MERTWAGMPTATGACDTQRTTSALPALAHAVETLLGAQGEFVATPPVDEGLANVRVLGRGPTADLRLDRLATYLLDRQLPAAMPVP